MAAAGEPTYRGTQLYHALYSERRFEFGEMKNLPARLRERLEAETRIGLPEIARRYVSRDGSVRYLFALPESTRVEAVFMPWSVPRDWRDARPKPSLRRRNSAVRSGDRSVRQTVCISTQAGCAVDCHFCLTAQLGLIRNLTAGEIVGQVLAALADNAATLAPRTNVVLMGQGEPLLNYDPVIAAVRLLLDPNGINLAARHVTLSTSGIVPGIERLAQEKIRPKLAISLNASNDEQRDAHMPINRKYPLEVLLTACRNYPLREREYLTFEYVMLGGMNDTRDDALRVTRLVRGLRAKINLIPWNPGELPYRAPAPEAVAVSRDIGGEEGSRVRALFPRARHRRSLRPTGAHRERFLFLGDFGDFIREDDCAARLGAS